MTLGPGHRSLTIAVLTFRRPDDLAEVLPLLVAQAETVLSSEMQPRVLVVDNDPEASARQQVQAFDVAAIPVDYVLERRPGIANARNRALDESADDDVLVFIDDDERPSNEWLSSLLRLRDETDAAAVVGPVTSKFEVQPEPWIELGRFFDRRRLSTGDVIEVAATNNLLLDRTVVRRLHLAFDTSLGMTGGEDTLFTRKLSQEGGLMIWCAEATVTDVVPAARTTRRWVVQRAFSSGNGWSITSVMLAGSGLRLGLRASLTASGLIRVAFGTLRALSGLVTRSLAREAGGVRTVARGAGMVSGAWGHRYSEYRR